MFDLSQTGPIALGFPNPTRGNRPRFSNELKERCRNGCKRGCGANDIQIFLLFFFHFFRKINNVGVFSSFHGCANVLPPQSIKETGRRGDDDAETVVVRVLAGEDGGGSF